MDKTEQRPAAMRERRSIEWLVNWTLEKQGFGRTMRDGAGGGRSGDIPSGMQVDGGGYSNDGKWVHEDARTINDLLNEMLCDNRTAVATALVVHYGQTGLQPDWGEEGSGRWQLVRANNGTGKAKRRFQDQTRQRHLLGFVWEWIGSDEKDLDRMMLEWLAWHAALCDLRDRANSRLRQYLATGPDAPDAPWDVPARRIHYPNDEAVDA